MVAIFAIGYGLGHGDADLVSRFHMDLYFESAGMILTLITLGKFFEARAKGRTSDAIRKLMDLAPKRAVVIRDGQEIEIDASDILRGDIAVIRAGDSIPADGVVKDGSGAVDEAAITGESIPVEKESGGPEMRKSGPRLLCGRSIPERKIPRTRKTGPWPESRLKTAGSRKRRRPEKGPPAPESASAGADKTAAPEDSIP